MKNLFVFTLGFAAGAVLVWKFMKRENCDDIYEKEPEPVEEKKEPEEKVETKDILQKAESIIKENSYRNYSRSSKKSQEKVYDDKPYVIPPDEFDELEDYEAMTLIYYAEDNVLTCNDDVVDDIDEIVGKDSLTHFGEYEEDSVCVRNDRLKCDYEILLDEGAYRDLLRDKPYLRGGTNNG